MYVTMNVSVCMLVKVVHGFVCVHVHCVYVSNSIFECMHAHIY